MVVVLAAGLAACGNDGAAMTTGTAGESSSTTASTTVDSTGSPTTGTTGSPTTGATGSGTTGLETTGGSTTGGTTTGGSTTGSSTTSESTGTGETSSSSTGPTPFCGDGVVDAGEQCDLGPDNSDNGMCKTDCTPQACGDGFVGPGEGCDDGNPVDDDACSNSCTPASCGDGVMQMGEACDDGNMEDADACTNACKQPACGDSIVQMGEECDDGDADDTDACLSTCKAATCGDGKIQGGVEECDDGNVVDTDACLPTCKAAACGDGKVQADVEECDDGNLDAGDGCSAACKKELALCQSGAVQLSVAPGNNMMACQNVNTCEQDYGTLCPIGWGLCSNKQFIARNTGWNFESNTQTLGAIRCRQQIGGAGHFTIGANLSLSIDHGDNCWYGSSRPQCVANYGCNEKGRVALCCAPTPSCGNGVVDSPEEECDDGNQNDGDPCFSNCINRTTNPGLTNCG
jgi:cysteine-rich repeat protein